MTRCPFDEKLTGMLDDVLSTADRDAVARHVEECASCQEHLARLTETPETALWRIAEHSPRSSSAEEATMQRLKQMPSWLTRRPM